MNAEKLIPETKYYLAHGDFVSLISPLNEFISTSLSSNIASSAKKTRLTPRNGYSMKFESVPPPSFYAHDAVRKAPRDFSSSFGLIEELGKGNFATVYLAVCRATGEKVAVKVIERSRFLNMSPSRWAQQVKEAEVLKKLNHPGIVSFRSLYQTNDSLYVVTELLSGGELFERLVNKGAYPEERGKILMKRILEAVAYLHERGIVHRDLKPENIVQSLFSFGNEGLSICLHLYPLPQVGE